MDEATQSEAALHPERGAEVALLTGPPSVRRILEYQPRGMTRAAAWLLVIAACAAGFFVNYLTGPTLDYGSVFLVPCIAAAWFLGRCAGFVTVAICAAAWFAATSLHASSPPYGVILANTLSRFVVFALLVWGFGLVRELLLRLRASSLTDPLTGLGNRRALEERGRHDLATADRVRTPVSLMYVDLDDFKAVNDNFGHDAGDEVLRETAEALRSGIRRTDFAARVGGDEFAILLIGSDTQAAELVAGKIRERLLASFRQKAWPVTLSIGIATRTTARESFAALVSVADRLMYSAKKAGKNAIVTGAVVREGERR